MEFTSEFRDRRDAIEALFAETFAASEGADEGRVIGQLVKDLLTSVADEDRRVFSVLDSGELLGSVVFTRLTFEDDDRVVFLLSPLAVKTGEQGRGVGQALLRHALTQLQADGVDVVLTYGDPDFYGRVGFRTIAEEVVRAPQPLQYPHGWLARTMEDRPLDPLRGRSHCVGPLDTPDLW